MPEKLRSLDDFSEPEFSLLPDESSTTDRRLKAEADGRLRIVGSDMLKVLSIAAAAKANIPPDLGFLAAVRVEPVEAVYWC